MPEIQPSPTPSQPPETKALPVRRKSLFSNLYDDILGIGLTLAAGLGTGWAMIDKNFFKNGEKEKRFDAQRKTRDDELIKLNNNAKGEEWLKGRSKVMSEYYKDVQAEMKKLGVETPIGKFRSLARHQKWEVGLTMAAVTGAALGFVSNFVTTRENSRQQQDVFDQLTRWEAERDRNGGHSL